MKITKEIILSKIDKEFEKYSSYINTDILSIESAKKIMIDFSYEIIKMNGINNVVVELSPANKCKFTILFNNKKTLMISKLFDNVEGMDDKDIIFTFFSAEREILISTASKINIIADAINEYNMKNKYTFIEFLAAMEGDNFDVIETSCLTHFTNYINTYVQDMLLNNFHQGDCTDYPHTCNLCLLESELKSYREYIFDEENWRKENLN